MDQTAIDELDGELIEVILAYIGHSYRTNKEIALEIIAKLSSDEFCEMVDSIPSDFSCLDKVA